jgi:sterol 3beta-glucosyltransferase
MTHITILAIGSRGDVQPFVALGRGLQKAGYTVRIAAAEDYEQLVRAYGLPFAPLFGSVRPLLDSEAVYAVRDGGRHALKVARHFFGVVRPLFPRLMADCWTASRDAAALIVSTLGVYCGWDIARTLGIPLVVAHMHPVAATGTAPHLFFPVLPRGLPRTPDYNLLTHMLAEHAFWQFLRLPLNDARQRVLGLPPLGPMALSRRLQSAQPPQLCAYSPAIAPLPADCDESVHVTGYWFLDRPADWQPSPELTAFLDAGPPPVAISFGSIWLGRDGDRLTRLAMAAVEQAGVRAVLHAGWGDLGNISLPSSMLRVESVPHDWLFRRVRAVVHHGGAGVTAAALRAGIPSVVVPFLGDQLFWATRVWELGAASRPLPHHSLTVERLAAALETVVADAAMRERAAVLAEQVRGEDGVAQAVGLITRQLNNRTDV